MNSTTIKRGSVVSVTYTIVDQRGEVVEAVEIPVEYMQGSDNGLFPEIEAALEGKGCGERITVTLTPEAGFGHHDPHKTFTDVIENVPPEYRHLGAEAEFHNDRGETLKMVVTHVDNGTVTLDGNHPLAGKTLTFHVTVQAIREATAAERQHGLQPAITGNGSH